MCSKQLSVRGEIMSAAETYRSIHTQRRVSALLTASRRGDKSVSQALLIELISRERYFSWLLRVYPSTATQHLPTRRPIKRFPLDAFFVPRVQYVCVRARPNQDFSSTSMPEKEHGKTMSDRPATRTKPEESKSISSLVLRFGAAAVL